MEIVKDFACEAKFLHIFIVHHCSSFFRFFLHFFVFFHFLFFLLLFLFHFSCFFHFFNFCSFFHFLHFCSFFFSFYFSFLGCSKSETKKKHFFEPSLDVPLRAPLFSFFLLSFLKKNIFSFFSFSFSFLQKKVSSFLFSCISFKNV